MIRIKTEDGHFTKATKVVSAVCAVIGVLISLGTITFKVSQANAWDSELIVFKEHTAEAMEKIIKQQDQRYCQYIIQQLNLLRAKERSEDEEVTEYDLFWKDQLIAQKEQHCHHSS